MALEAPFSYVGGKSVVADLVWGKLGKVDNYIEPFAGSLAVLLNKPDYVGNIHEIVNDKNHFISNFWRSLANDPDGIISFADTPVNESQLHAVHNWLMLSDESKEIKDKIYSDPSFYSVKMAGYWLYGAGCWIGGAWCSPGSMKENMTKVRESKPKLSGGYGCDRTTPKEFINTHSNISEAHTAFLKDWYYGLKVRLRRVYVCCGSWERVVSCESITTSIGITGVFLDPPYAHDLVRLKSIMDGDKEIKTGIRNRDCNIYANDGDDIDKLVVDVNKWCIENGKHPKMRIVLAGYDGEHNNLVESHGWTVIEWKSSGGYGSLRKVSVNDNCNRERLWISPYCVHKKAGLFY